MVVRVHDFQKSVCTRTLLGHHASLGRLLFLFVLVVVSMCLHSSLASTQLHSARSYSIPARPFWKTGQAGLPETPVRNSYELLQVLLPVRLEDGPKTRLATYTWWGILRLDGCPGHEETIWMALAKDLKDLSFRGNLVVLHGNLNQIVQDGTSGAEILSRLQVESYDLVDRPDPQLNRIGADTESLRIHVADPLPTVWFDVPSLALVVVSSSGTLRFDGPLRLDDPTHATLCRDVVALVARLGRERAYAGEK